MDQDRKDFLLAMYKELFNNIDRHISLSWQSISIVAAFLTSFILTEKFKVPSFITVFFLIIIITWTIARLIDAEHWYERNIHIISNIEKIFLTEDDDAKNIHYYFTKNRTKKNKLESVLIQSFASTMLWMIAVGYYVWRIPKSIKENLHVFDVNIETGVLMSFSVILAILLYIYRQKNLKSIEKLRTRSPGLNTSI